jgi:UDP-glucuronate 4-epimerase
MSILLTGAAGFIGYHVAEALLARGEQVIGVDSLTPYYDVRLKQARLDRLASKRGFSFHRLDVAEREAIDDLISRNRTLPAIVHLAAQAGVRHSLIDPYEYMRANVLGHLVILEAARRVTGLRHIVYASSSSVYGANTKLPFTETDRVDTPVSLYAATKRADELMSYTYAHLFGLCQTGLRFFTVYGPWGRPDMAYYSFARAILAGEPITLYEGGTLRRDFTYIDDIVAGVVAVIDRPPSGTPPARVLNIGNHRSEPVTALIGELERALGRRAVIQTAPRPLVDVEETFASVDAIAELAGFVPRTTLAEGIPRFVSWFREWHGVSG